MTMPSQITGVHTVGVPVTDQDRAIDFYVGTLGFDKRLDASLGGGRRWIEVAPGGSAVTIALVAAKEGIPAGVETGIRFTAADADAVHGRDAGQRRRRGRRAALAGRPAHVRVPRPGRQRHGDRGAALRNRRSAGVAGRAGPGGWGTGARECSGNPPAPQIGQGSGLRYAPGGRGAATRRETSHHAPRPRTPHIALRSNRDDVT
jgi:catechol 2,3-dioxygenase-like lactoylglutathione lyase family enzyme